MKVLKIEKSKRYFTRKINEQGNIVRKSTFNVKRMFETKVEMKQDGSSGRRKSLTQIENQPFSELKQEIIES